MTDASTIQHEILPQVNIDVIGDTTNDEQCQITSYMNTTNPTLVATVNNDPNSFVFRQFGTMFTLNAKHDLEILTFEFAHYDPISIGSKEAENGIDVEIYVKTGSEFLDAVENSLEWIEVAKSTAYISPDYSSHILPRSDMRSIKMEQGQQLSFYITLKENNLKLERPSSESNVNGLSLTTGSTFLYDDFIDLSVGIGINGYDFPQGIPPTMDRIFQGVIHYRSVQSCSDGTLVDVVSNQIPLSFTVQTISSTSDLSIFNTVIQETFEEYLQQYVELRKMKSSHGLKLNRITEDTRKPAGETLSGSECLGLPTTSTSSSTSSSSANDGSDADAATDEAAAAAGGNATTTTTGGSATCTVVHIISDWSHFESISFEELQWRLYMALTENKQRIGILDDGTKIRYIGNELISQTYNLVLDGVPKGTVLNPIQRRYIGDVTYDFLDTFVATGGEDDDSTVVYGVEIETQTTIAERRLVVSANTTTTSSMMQQQQKHMLRGDSSSSSGETSSDEHYSNYYGDVDDDQDSTGVPKNLRSQQQRRRLATLETPAIVYGIGDPKNSKEYFKVVEDAFKKNEQRYKLELSKNQFRPGEINDFGNVGTVFQDLTNVKVTPVSGDVGGGDGGGSTGSGGYSGGDQGRFVGDQWIYIWTGVLAFSVVFLTYRIAKDYFLVSTEAKVQKKERLSERQARLKEEQQKRRERRRERRQQKKERRRERRGRGRERSESDSDSEADDRSRASRFIPRKLRGRGKYKKNRGDGRPPSPGLDRDKMDALLSGRPTDLTSEGNSPQADDFRRSTQDLVPITPRNRAGEHGRGIAASKSLPLSPRDRDNRGNDRKLDDMDLASPAGSRASSRNQKPTLSTSSSNHSLTTARNRAGERGRGVSSSRSMPMAPRRQASTSGGGMRKDESLASLASSRNRGGKPTKSKSFDNSRGLHDSDRLDGPGDVYVKSLGGDDGRRRGGLPSRSRSFDSNSLSRGSSHSERSQRSYDRRRPRRNSRDDGLESVHSERSGRSRDRSQSRPLQRSRSADNLRRSSHSERRISENDYGSVHSGRSRRSGAPSRSKSAGNLNSGSSHSHRSSDRSARERRSRPVTARGDKNFGIPKTISTGPSPDDQPGSMRGVERADSMPRSRAGERRGISASKSMEARPRDMRPLGASSTHSVGSASRPPRNRASEIRREISAKSMPPIKKKASTKSLGSNGSDRSRPKVVNGSDTPPQLPINASKVPKSPSSAKKSPGSVTKKKKSKSLTSKTSPAGSVEASPASSAKKSVSSDKKAIRKIKYDPDGKKGKEAESKKSKDPEGKKTKIPKKSKSTEVKSTAKRAARPDPPPKKSPEEQARWDNLKAAFVKYSNYSLAPGESESQDAVVRSFRRYEYPLYASEDVVSDKEIVELLDDWYYRKIRKSVSDDGVYEGFHLNPKRPENRNEKSPEEMEKWEKRTQEFLDFSNYRLLPGENATRASIVESFRKHHKHYATKKSISDSEIVELLDDWYNRKIGRQVGKDKVYEGIQLNPKYTD